LASHPGGQQPSPPRQAVVRAWLQAREQPSTVPLVQSVVHASPSSHEPAQAPGKPVVIARSQASPALRTPSPQTTGQSPSVAIVHRLGQQPSPEAQDVTGLATQVALHDVETPTKWKGVHASVSRHPVGQAFGLTP
jgi:hypothetical protein